jgi:hypothetical protein
MVRQHRILGLIVDDRLNWKAHCEAGLPTLSEMKELNTKIVATRVLMNERHPIRHFFTIRRIQDEYAMRKGTP